MRCFILLIVSFLGISSNGVDAKLETVFIVHQNGERTPFYTYPKDPYASYSYDRLGFNALTEHGIKQMYNHGEVLRDAYKHLQAHEGTYRPYNLQANSSNIGHCLLSGQAVLAGFYPPSDSYLPINWQPIPIDRVPLQQDYNVPLISCPKYISQVNSLCQSPPNYITRLLTRDKEMVDAITANSGLKAVNIRAITSLLDTMNIQSQWNLTLPEWFKAEYLTNTHEYTAKFLKLLSETDSLKKLGAGSLLSQIVREMEHSVAGATARRINFYSGLTQTIAALQRAIPMDTQLPDVPDFGATFAFELHTEHEVQLKYYRHAGDTHPINILLSNCPAPCLLQQFKAMLKAVLVDDIKALC